MKRTVAAAEVEHHGCLRLDEGDEPLQANAMLELRDAGSLVSEAVIMRRVVGGQLVHVWHGMLIEGAASRALVVLRDMFNGVLVIGNFEGVIHSRRGSTPGSSWHP